MIQIFFSLTISYTNKTKFALDFPAILLYHHAISCIYITHQNVNPWTCTVVLCGGSRIQHRGGVGSSPRYRCSDHGAPSKPPLQICTYSSLEGEARDERLWDKPLLTYFLDPPLEGVHSAWDIHATTPFTVDTNLWLHSKLPMINVALFQW
jgi:hypothetical protein